MRKKNFIYIAALSVLTSFAFVGCGDDDDPVVNIPAGTVSELSFTDENPEPVKVSGKLSWKAPASMDGITKFVIYGSADGKSKDVKIAEVEASVTSYDIKDLVNLGYLSIYAANKDGEAATCASIKVTDLAEKGFLRLYFLNSGKFGNNNSSLYMYDVDKDEVVDNYFEAQNGRKLGDSAQDMIVYGNKMYIAVYGESTIEVTDLEAKSIKQIKTEGQPRALVSDGGKVYASYYNGNLARLDTASLEVEATIKIGRNPEQIAIANNKLYVANSGGMDYNTPVGYDKTVSVVDIPSFKETKKIDVVLNPTCVQADEQGNVYVVSMGNYADVPNTLQVIDSKTDEAKVLEACPNATEMSYTDGTLYTYYSQYDANWNTTITYTAYNTTTGKANEWKKDTEIKKPYKLCTAGGNVYISESDYTNNGDFYGFETTGKLIKKFGVGLNPMKVVLAQKNGSI